MRCGAHFLLQIATLTPCLVIARKGKRKEKISFWCVWIQRGKEKRKEKKILIFGWLREVK